MSQVCLPVARQKKKKQGSKDGDDTTLITTVDFGDIQNMDATSYLSMVSQQAKNMPDTFIAPKSKRQNNDCENFVSKKRAKINKGCIQGSAASLNYLISDRVSLTPAPTRQHIPQYDEWIQQTISNFENLRDYLQRCKNFGIGGKRTARVPVPPMKDRPGWHIFCVGENEARGNVNSYFDDDDDDDNNNNSDNNNVEENSKKNVNNKDDGNHEEEEEEDEVPEWKKLVPQDGHDPSVDILLQLDQVLVRRVLHHLSYYTTKGWEPHTKQRSAWLYGLLACLERPIHRDDAAMLFSLLRCLTQYRAMTDVSQRDVISRSNVLIMLIGVYFEQAGKSCVTEVREK